MKTLSSIILKASVMTTLVAFLLISCNEDEEAIKPQVATTPETGTEAIKPEVGTTATSDINFNSVTLSGTISSNGGSEIIVKGFCYGTISAPTIEGDTTGQGAGNENFVAHLSGLTPNTTYYARAYAINEIGTSYGAELSFTTNPGLPVVMMNTSEILYKEATVDLSITSSGASAINNSGFVYSTTTALPTISDNMWPSISSELTVEYTLTELEIGTKYYVRAFAQNSQGIAYSNVTEITTLNLSNITDIDGNAYTAVTIGDQIWMVQNLKTTKFSNGDAIPTTATVNQSIAGEVNPIYQWAPNGDNSTIESYGRLYTSAVATDDRNVCPGGWHVTTFDEYQELLALSGNNGNKLKTQGTNNWSEANGTNELGFNAVGAGIRFAEGYTSFFKIYGEMWTQDSYSDTEQKSMLLYSSYSYFDYAIRPKNDGRSVRCVLD